MKKLLFVLLTTILSFNSQAQFSFEKGYYITNSNEKVECLILNMGWNSNPSAIEYKLTENSEKQNATMASVKEFGVYNSFKYVRQTVKIDDSSDDLNELSTNRKPNFQEREVFLKVLVEGRATLYAYKGANSPRYFYSKDNSEIEQLVFKMHLIQGNKIANNNTYKQQLLTELTCPSFTVAKIEKVDYKQSELIEFFADYNECQDNEFVNFEKKQNRDLFNLTIRPGVSRSSLSIDNGVSNINDVTFDEQSTIRIGLEAEFIMPFYKNKFAVLIEPTYQYYKAEKEVTAYFVTQNVKVDYTSIEIPLGLRHYMYLNKKSKFFVNAAIVIDFKGNSVITFENRENLPIKTSSNIALGLGYKYNDRFSLEFRYHTKRQVLKNYVNWDTEYKTSSLILGYTLF